MGTSTAYNAPKTPEWGAVKRLVTRTAPDGRPGNDVAGRAVREFINAAGGLRGYARGRGPVATTRPAQRVAANVAGFVGMVAAAGLPAALVQIGLEGLVGRPIGEVLDAIVDVLGGAPNTLDDVDARNALSDLREELFARASSFDELEVLLAQTAEGQALTDMFSHYYGLFLYHQFCRVFYERLVQRVGAQMAESYLGGIRDFLDSALREQQVNRDLRGIDWGGAEGRQIAVELLERTLVVFGGE